MSGLGFASAACSVACPYGVTQWATDVNSGGVVNGYTTGGFAWPRFVYDSTLSTDPSKSPKKEVVDGTQRGLRVGIARAAALTADTLSAVPGSIMRTSGLAPKSVAFSVQTTVLNTLILGQEDSGTTVFLTNMNMGVNGRLVIPSVASGTDGWTCTILYGQGCGNTGAQDGNLIIESLWPTTANTLASRTGKGQYSYVWGGAANIGTQAQIGPGGFGSNDAGFDLTNGTATSTGYRATIFGSGNGGGNGGNQLGPGASVTVKIMSNPGGYVVQFITVNVPFGGPAPGNKMVQYALIGV
jgi:hypothetical protein